MCVCMCVCVCVRVYKQIYDILIESHSSKTIAVGIYKYIIIFTYECA